MGMIPIRGNWLGLAMFAGGGLVALIGGFVLKLTDQPVMIAVGIALIAMDAVFRSFSFRSPGWAFSRERGGYFFFLPVWLLGVAVVVLNLLILFGVINR